MYKILFHLYHAAWAVLFLGTGYWAGWTAMLAAFLILGVLFAVWA